MYEYNSKKIKKGQIFICLPGGEKYITEARANGARDVITLSRQEMAQLASKHYNFPDKELFVIGITGTNGKTTTTYLVKKGLEEAGYKPYVLGTINSELTTPESLDIFRLMEEHRKNKGTHFVMEVSSHAIAQDRIYGIDFNIKLLTNITQDHLDFHKTIDQYKQTKLSFMKTGQISIYPEDYKKEKIFFKNPLVGRFNTYNMQAAIAILKKCQLQEEIIWQALSQAEPPPGRFQYINFGQPFEVIIDYAHTPDGLKNILSEAQYLAEKKQGRVLVVFGCGGDRDRSKRPLMGKVVENFAQYFIITSDNPRTEDERAIVQDILQGINQDKNNYEIEIDRQQAIEKIIFFAKENDVVVIAGKGHEKYQILKNTKICFDDTLEAKKALTKRLNGN